MNRSAFLAVAVGCCVVAFACGGSDDGGGGNGGTSTSSGQGGSGAGSGGHTSSGGASSGGGGGSAGGGGGAVSGSEGCGNPLTDATGEWVGKAIDVGGAQREYFVYLPVSYDPARPYPVVYQFHGCSSNPDRQNNNPPVQDYVQGDAIVIRGKAVADCWDNSPTGTGIALFDAMVPEVEATYCADPERRFATGYSSGSFMTHQLACKRGDVLRGVATIAGGLAGNNCVGKVAALLIHDADDPTVSISASEQARDRHLDNNSCDAQAATSPGDHPPCEVYAGCDPGYPVVWCQTSGQGHARQDSLSAPAFWDFLAVL